MRREGIPRARRSSALSGCIAMSVFLSFALGLAGSARATELDLSTGFYSLVAKSADRSARRSNLGVYRLTLYHPILSGLDLSAGYTVALSGIVVGDLEYGWDIGISWFPLTRSEGIRVRAPAVSFELVERTRPYLGLSFNQRQFQAVSAGYGGVGIALGLEYQAFESMGFRSELRTVFLKASRTVSAREINVLLGTSFQL